MDKHDIIQKTDVHNILHCRQRISESRPQSTRTEHFVKCGVWFLRYATGQT